MPQLTVSTGITFSINLIVLTSYVHCVHSSFVWNYGNINAWREVSELCVSGKQQSPISIASASAVTDPRLLSDPLTFSGYGGSYDGVFLNNGRTLVFDISQRDVTSFTTPHILGGGLNGRAYVFAQMLFHWGDGSVVQGSEHVIDGKSAPIEMHLVHYHAKYPTITEARNHEDGLVVVAFLLEPTFFPTPLKTNLTQIADYIKEIPAEGNKVHALLDFNQIMPKWVNEASNVFYRYKGSMTMPPCSETVTWIVMDQRIVFDDSIVDEFLKVTTNLTDPVTKKPYKVSLTNNFRPIQPLNGRVVSTNRVTALAVNGTRLKSKANSSRNNGSRSTIKSSFLFAGSISLLPVIFTLFYNQLYYLNHSN